MTGNKVEFRIEAVDNTKDAFNNVGSSVDGMTTKVKKNGEQLSAWAKNNEKTFRGMAVAGTVAVGAVTGIISKSLNAWGTQAKAVALVENGMRKYADTWKTTTDDLLAEASRLQENSIYGDEEILQKVTNNLLTFGSIGEDIFNQTQQTALDLATTLQGDLQSSTIMLGKALEDPARGLAALSRVGIRFTADQEKMIVALQESGDLLGSQSLILESIEGLYGGAAKAAADALGPTHQLNKQIGDLREDIGAALRPAIDQLAESVRPLVKDMSEWIKENGELFSTILLGIGIVGGLVAGLGTLGLVIPSIVAGFGAVVTAITAVKTAMLFLAANPIGLLIAAIAGLAFLVYTYRDEISEVITKAIDRIWTRIEPFVTRVTDAWQRMSEVISAVWDLARGWISEVFGHYLDSIVSFFDAFRALLQGDWDGFLNHMKASIDSGMKFISKIWELAMTGMGLIAEAIRESIKGQFTNALDRIVSILNTARSWVDDAFTYMLDGIGGIARNIMNGILGIIEGFVNSAINMLNGLIRAANMIPGINIPMIATISFGRLAHGGLVGEGLRGGQAIQSFMSGGVVQGNRGVDRVPILASAGELVLNKAQQRNLASHLNGGGGGINIYVSGNQFYGDDEQFAEKIGDTLMEKIKNDGRFASF